MPKIKLKKQDNYEFEYKTILQVRDINYGGHLGNDSLVALTHEARIDLMNKLEFTELNIGKENIGIIMTDLAVNFLGEGFLLDEVTVHSHIDEISNVAFRVFHYIEKNGKPVALAETGVYAFDYLERTIAEIPEQFLNALKSYNEK